MTPLLTGVFASQISGHLYARPTGAFDALASFTVPTGGLADVTFANIPQEYTHLQLRITAKFVSNSEVDLVFNGDTGSNYSGHWISGGGSGTPGYAYNAPYTSNVIGWMATSTNIYPTMIVDILDYTNTNKYKTTRNSFGYDSNGSGTVWLCSNHWRSTSAINNIKFFGGVNIEAGSVLSLYGVK